MNKKTSTSNSLSTKSDNKHVEILYEKIANHIDRARYNVQKTVDTEMVKAYWLIGKDIVEEEQKGKSVLNMVVYC